PRPASAALRRDPRRSWHRARQRSLRPWAQYRARRRNRSRPEPAAARTTVTDRQERVGIAEALVTPSFEARNFLFDKPRTARGCLYRRRVKNDHRNGERHQTEQLGRGEANVERAGLATSGTRIAQRSLKERAENIAHARRRSA